MRIGTWLRHVIFGLSPEERFCHNCAFCSEKRLEQILEPAHDVVRHHLAVGGWHPRGKQKTGPLGWCDKNNYATVLTAIACEEWKERKGKDRG